MQKRSLFIIIILSLMLVPSTLAIRSHYIYDNANVVSDYMENLINNFGAGCDTANTAEIVIVTLQDLPDGKTIEETKLYYFNDVPLDGVKGIGKAGKDNGVLILLVMETHDWAIEVGYGCEGQLTDAECGRIGRDIMTPYFKDGNFGDGLFRGMQSVATELGYSTTITYVEPTDTTTTTDEEIPLWMWVLGILVVIIVIFMIVMVSDSGGSGYSSGSHSSSGSGSSSGGGFGGGGSGGGGGEGHWNLPSTVSLALGAIIAMEFLKNFTTEGKCACPKCTKDTDYAEIEQFTERELDYNNKYSKRVCLDCGMIYKFLLSTSPIIRYVPRSEPSRESRSHDSDSRSSYRPSYSGGGRSGGGGFGGGSSGGGGARGKW